MRKIIIQQFISADGFVADRFNSTSFFEQFGGENGKEIDQDMLNFIGTIDTILLGAKTYEFFVDYWPEVGSSEELVADALNTTPKIVFSESLKEAPWGDYEPVKIVNSDVAQYINSLKDQPGKDMVVWGSISICKYLIDHRLVDEVQLRIVPVALGMGTLLFPEIPDFIEMELLETKVYGAGVVFTRYALNYD